MKRSKFTEERIIALLREQGRPVCRRGEDGRGLPSARDQHLDFLRLEGEVWGHGAVRDEASEGARGVSP